MLTAVFLLFSGFVQAAISPPWNLVALHPVAWLPALWVFSQLRGRRALVAGWLVGISASLTIFYWLPGTMMRFGDLPAVAAAFVWLLFGAAMGFYVAIFAYGFGAVRRVAGPSWPAAIGVWFCALEFLNPHLFGYLQGDAWYQMPRLFLVSAVTGVSGVTFLVLMTNAVLLQAIEAWQSAERARWRPVIVNTALLAALLGSAAAYSTMRLADIGAAEAAAQPLRVAVIQPNYTIERRHQMERGMPDVFARDLLALSNQAAARSTDAEIEVYVWPEGALRIDPGQQPNTPVLDFVRRSGAEIWTGANHRDLKATPTVFHNSAFRIFGEGTIDRRYDKNILVPFGEYVPLRDVIPGFDRLPTVGNFEPGREVPVYQAGPARFVFLICYEAIRRSFVREAATGDVNLLVNVTVDAWYGDSSEQSQHLMLAAVQSALHGIPMVRSTTTGISALIDARGLLTAQTSKFTREVIVGDVRPLRVASLYSRWGDWFAWLCVAASALMLVVAARSRR